MIHFNFWGPKKPWKPCHRPYRRLYHDAMRAVGQTPPREELLGWWHDRRTRRHLKLIGRRFEQVGGLIREGRSLSGGSRGGRPRA